MSIRLKCLVFILVVPMLSGCGSRNESFEAQVRAPEASGGPNQPLEDTLTNRFGMTFRLISVDPDRAEHLDGFPTKSYYIQESVLTYDQRDAIGRAIGPAFSETESLNEWINYSTLARILSENDPDFDYRLPSEEEWLFVYMNGYKQQCPLRSEQIQLRLNRRNASSGSAKASRNSFGLRGLYEQNAECLDMPGHFMGIGPGTEDEDCRLSVVKGNPNADDGLNEIIVGRFVLIRR